MWPMMVTPPASAAAEPLVKSSTQRCGCGKSGWRRQADVGFDGSGKRQPAYHLDLALARHVIANLRDPAARNCPVGCRGCVRSDDAATAYHQELPVGWVGPPGRATETAQEAASRPPSTPPRGRHLLASSPGFHRTLENSLPGSSGGLPGQDSHSLVDRPFGGHAAI